MDIWFYLFWILLIVFLFLILKIFLIKKEIKNIDRTLSMILKSDTNRLITVNTNDKDLKKFASLLNKNLKKLRKLELEYKNGSGELKSSITNISHDLRTPLTAVRGYLDLIDDENLTEKQVKYLKIINHKVKDLTELTEQLFDFSKNIDIQESLKKENFCINDILEESIASSYSLFKENSITPEIEICEEKIIRLINKNTLHRVFENIISNAIKYSDGDFHVKLYRNGTIEFSNKTNQLDSTSLEKIFDRYYTVRNAKKSNGIGLSIAKQLVEFMNGQIVAIYKNHRLIIKIDFIQRENNIIN